MKSTITSLLLIALSSFSLLANGGGATDAPSQHREFSRVFIEADRLSIWTRMKISSDGKQFAYAELAIKDRQAIFFENKQRLLYKDSQLLLDEKPLDLSGVKNVLLDKDGTLKLNTYIRTFE